MTSVTENNARFIAAGIGRRPDVDVARDVGVSRERVRQVRSRLKMPNPRPMLKAVRDAAILDDILARKLNHKSIGKKYGLTAPTISHVGTDAGVDSSDRCWAARRRHTNQEILQALIECRGSIPETGKKLGYRYLHQVIHGRTIEFRNQVRSIQIAFGTRKHRHVLRPNRRGV